MENWKIIENVTNYEVSDLGQIRNTKTNYILKGRLSKSGYLQVSLTDKETKKQKNYYIHRLVAIYFLENLDNKREVNHKDGNKLNNNVDNLEWVTPSENQKHRQKILGKTKTSQRKIGKFNKDHVLIEEYPSIVDAAKSFGKSRVNIDNALQGKQKTAYGFIWEYLD